MQMQAMEDKIDRAVTAGREWKQTSAAWLWLYFNEDSVTGPDGTYLEPEAKVRQWVEVKGLDLLHLTEDELKRQVRAYLGAWARRAKQLTLERRGEGEWKLPSNLDWPTMLDEMRDAEVQARRGVRRRVGIQAAPTVEPNKRLIGDVEASEFYGDFYIWMHEHKEALGHDRATRVRQMASFAVEEKERGESPPQDRGNQKGRKRATRVSLDAIREVALAGDWTVEDERMVGLR
jgi:hypothetical protein